MIGLFIVREEGGLYERVDPVTWLMSDAPIWGFSVGRLRLIYDTILKRYDLSPWRARVDPPPLVERLDWNTDRWVMGFNPH